MRIFDTQFFLVTVLEWRWLEIEIHASERKCCFSTSSRTTNNSKQLAHPEVSQREKPDSPKRAKDQHR